MLCYVSVISLPEIVVLDKHQMVQSENGNIFFILCWFGKSVRSRVHIFRPQGTIGILFGILFKYHHIIFVYEFKIVSTYIDERAKEKEKGDFGTFFFVAQKWARNLMPFPLKMLIHC